LSQAKLGTLKFKYRFIQSTHFLLASYIIFLYYTLFSPIFIGLRIIESFVQIRNFCRKHQAYREKSTFKLNHYNPKHNREMPIYVWDFLDFISNAMYRNLDKSYFIPFLHLIQIFLSLENDVETLRHGRVINVPIIGTSSSSNLNQFSSSANAQQCCVSYTKTTL
jgi:hypothetical protein